ncbi:MAG: hypothetical protein E4G96_03240 [Chrysiogenales bacterium]|nr:MAG: hypothetical protein E4G96_03240 [Chrysiogenales bacterium]
MLRTIILSVLVLLLLEQGLRPGLMINEFVAETESDWVELTFVSAEGKKIDISSFFITMYYGNNERLSHDPVSIYSHDRPETPYDDRFVVVHLAMPDVPDETDLTGDTNGNGRIDVYCNNYFGSLWNTDGVVAIDSDDDPGNGGIVDFVFYSNRDGSPNDTVLSYVAAALAQGQWQNYTGKTSQDCAVSIGKKGLASHMSLSRTHNVDTNTANDFMISSVQTPGRPNITLPSHPFRHLFRPLRQRLTIIPGHIYFGRGEIPLFVFFPCILKTRIFSMDGFLIHESPMGIPANPGLFSLVWNPLFQRRNPPTGLYLCKIEALNSSLRMAEERVIYIVLSHYR